MVALTPAAGPAITEHKLPMLPPRPPKPPPPRPPRPPPPPPARIAARPLMVTCWYARPTQGGAGPQTAVESCTSGQTRSVNLPHVRSTSNSYRALALQRNDATRL